MSSVRFHSVRDAAVEACLAINRKITVALESLNKEENNLRRQVAVEEARVQQGMVSKNKGKGKVSGAAKLKAVMQQKKDMDEVTYDQIPVHLSRPDISHRDPPHPPASALDPGDSGRFLHHSV